MEVTKNRLPAALAETYQALVEPTRIRFVRPIDREIDLRTMSAEDAALIAKHHPEILIKKERPAKLKKELPEGTQDESN